jgi:hypothetical protein
MMGEGARKQAEEVVDGPSRDRSADALAVNAIS